MWVGIRQTAYVKLGGTLISLHGSMVQIKSPVVWGSLIIARFNGIDQNSCSVIIARFNGTDQKSCRVIIAQFNDTDQKSCSVRQPDHSQRTFKQLWCALSSILCTIHIYLPIPWDMAKLRRPSRPWLNCYLFPILRYLQTNITTNRPLHPIPQRHRCTGHWADL